MTTRTKFYIWLAALATVACLLATGAGIILKADWTIIVYGSTHFFLWLTVNLTAKGYRETELENSSPPETAEMPFVFDAIDSYEEVGVDNVARNRRIVNAFINFLLNNTSGGNSIPADGLQVKYSTMHKVHGLSHAEWRKLCLFLQGRTSRGYMTRSPGGGVATWARRSYIMQTLERARRFGKIGGLPHEPELPDPYLTYTGVEKLST